MFQYKTVVTDYEGMQEALSTYAGQGWRLISANPDTWRVSAGKLPGGDPLGLASTGDAAGAPEYCASYYLLVFERDEDVASSSVAEAAHSEPHDYSSFSLPDY